MSITLLPGKAPGGPQQCRRPRRQNLIVGIFFAAGAFVPFFVLPRPRSPLAHRGLCVAADPRRRCCWGQPKRQTLSHLQRQTHGIRQSHPPANVTWPPSTSTYLHLLVILISSTSHLHLILISFTSHLHFYYLNTPTSHSQVTPLAATTKLEEASCPVSFLVRLGSLAPWEFCQRTLSHDARRANCLFSSLLSLTAAAAAAVAAW